MLITKKPLMIFILSILSLALLSLLGGCSPKAAYQLYELDFDISQHEPDDIQILAMGKEDLLYGVSRVLYNETGSGYTTVLGAYRYAYDGRHIPLLEADDRNSYPNHFFHSGVINGENYAFSLIRPAMDRDYYYTEVFAGTGQGSANSIYAGKSYFSHLPKFISLNDKIYFIASKESQSIILYDTESEFRSITGREMQLNYEGKEFRLLSTEDISSNNKEILLPLENGGKGYYGIHDGTALTLVWPTDSEYLMSGLMEKGLLACRYPEKGGTASQEIYYDKGFLYSQAEKQLKKVLPEGHYQNLVSDGKSNALVIERDDFLEPKIVLQHIWLTPEERIEAATVTLPAGLSTERFLIFPVKEKAFGLRFIEDGRLFLYTDEKPAGNSLLRKVTTTESSAATNPAEPRSPEPAAALPTQPARPALPPVQKTEKIIEGYEADHILYQDSYTTSGILFFNVRFIPEFGKKNQGAAFIDHERKQLEISIGVNVFSLGKHNIQPSLTYTVSLDTYEILNKEIVFSGVPATDGGLDNLTDEKLADIARLYEEIIHKGAALYGQEYNPEIEYTSDSINQLSYYSDKRLLNYALKADGAFSESCSYELYLRFLASPFTLLEEISKLTPEDQRHVLNTLCYYPRNYDFQEEFDPVLDRVSINDTITLLREVYETRPPVY